MPIRVGTGTKNMVPGLREVSLEVFLLSLSSVSVSGFRASFFGGVDRNLQIREQRRKSLIMLSVADMDPGSVAFLTPGSRMGKIRIPDPGSATLFVLCTKTMEIQYRT